MPSHPSLALRTVAVLALGTGTVHAATLRVGPGHAYATPCAAIAAAQDNDTIEIDAAGNYAGDVCAFAKNGLTLRSVNGRAHLPAAGAHAQGKATWVVQGNDTTVEGIEFSGSRVPDRNGAGIRLEGNHLTVRDCVFRDNENGILSGALPNSVITIEYTEFVDNGDGRGQAHNVYIGDSARLVFRYNWSHGARVGHLLKSRARENLVAYNRMGGDADGTQSYEMSFPNGGRNWVIGNVLQQSSATSNGALLDMLSEGNAHADSQLFVASNTFVNDRGAGTFMQVPTSVPLVARNNIFAGAGTVTQHGSAVLENNLVGVDPRFFDRSSYDYRLLPESPAIDAGIASGSGDGVSLMPTHEYVHPASARTRATSGALDLGAFEAVAILFGDGFED